MLLLRSWITNEQLSPHSCVWEQGSLAPCPGNWTKASWCCAHWVSFQVRLLVSDGPHLRPNTSCSTWRYTSLKVSATCQCCRLLYSNAQWIPQDLLGCPEKSAVFAVCPLWMNDFLNFSVTKWETEWSWHWAVSSGVSCEEERAALELGSVCVIAAPAPLSQHQIRKW